MTALLGEDDPTHMILTPGATYGLNMAIWGLGLQLPQGAQIITSVSEHNAVLRPLHHLQKLRPDLHITYIGLRAGELDVDAFEQALQRPTRLVALVHASNVTGRVYDIAPLLARAKEAGAYTVVDAAQSIGHIPVHLAELHADVVAFPAHKGLRGPIGVGGLYIRPGVEIEPIFVGGTGKLSDSFYQPDEMPLRLETSTPNIPAIAGLNAALRWRETSGNDFHEREVQRAAALRDGVRHIPGIIRYDDDPSADYLGTISLKITNKSVEETGELLAANYGIICRTGLHCAPLIHAAIGSAPEGTVRLSCSGFTSEREIDIALDALTTLAG
ncbi:MAG TPA: aminotransferase class V-fold PLP-dependent enzyme [Armatimonadota bacterium]|nr:aminotransferase class V-fold PLP-dependent enzyme [Armatimonadota bacterium]